MLEHLVRDELATVAERIRPAPDPLGRLMARYRRRRRTRTALAGTAAALALLAVVPAAIGPRRSVGPEPDWNRQAWSQRLVESPPRGAVAAVPGYLAELTARLAPTHPDREARVLLVDDVGAARIAYVVFPPRSGAPGLTYTASYLADRGASPDALARGRVAFGGGMEPFTIEQFYGAGVTVGLAPAGCEVATAPLPSALDWHTESTRSYVVRSPADHRPEWWRVTCDGILRYEGPAPNLAERLPATVVTRARGTGRAEPTSLGVHWGYALNGPPVLLWEGRTAADGIAGDATVTTAPAVRGGWLGSVEGTLSDGTSWFWPFLVRTDPDTPSSLLAVRLGPAPSTAVLVVAPEGAAWIRAIHNGQSLARADVRDDAAMLSLPDRSGLVIEALGPTGAVLASAPLADTQVPPRLIDRWSED